MPKEAQRLGELDALDDSRRATSSGSPLAETEAADEFDVVHGSIGQNSALRGQSGAH